MQTTDAHSEKTNNFVLRFANVNGTGSASANGLVTKALFRMGLDVGPKNMFPSNIQGFPTWYEIRISSKGFTGRRGGVDLMVAMNSETFTKDLMALDAGGYLMFDSARYQTGKLPRDDIKFLPIPLTELSSAFGSGKARSMLSNIIYVGALAALIDIDMKHIKVLIDELYGAKPKLIEANIKALALGYDYASKHFNCPLDIRLKGSPTRDDILVDGNQALALGAVFAGATFCSWYPITPSTSVVDHFSSLCHKHRIDPKTGEHRFAIIQAEDELAACGMVLGASWNGARAFTATSGPGISLMAEFVGYAYYAEIPTVIFNIQRVGPSTGMPTRTQEADLLCCAFLSHGDTKHLLLFPGTVNECFEMAVRVFDLAEVYQTPVFVMSDIELGMNEYKARAFDWNDGFQHQRGKVLRKADLDRLERKWFRYEDVDGDGICYRTLPGEHPKLGANLTRGSGHDRYGRYTEDGSLYQDNMDRLARKINQAADHLPEPLVVTRDPAHNIGLIFIGVLQEPVHEALSELADHDLKINELRIRAFPFHSKVKSFVDEHKLILVLDQNRDGQLRSLLLVEEVGDARKLKSIKSYHGMPTTARELINLIKTSLGETPT